MTTTTTRVTNRGLGLTYDVTTIDGRHTVSLLGQQYQLSSPAALDPQGGTMDDSLLALLFWRAPRRNPTRRRVSSALLAPGDAITQLDFLGSDPPRLTFPASTLTITARLEATPRTSPDVAVGQTVDRHFDLGIRVAGELAETVRRTQTITRRAQDFDVEPPLDLGELGVSSGPFYAPGGAPIVPPRKHSWTRAIELTEPADVTLVNESDFAVIVDGTITFRWT